MRTGPPSVTACTSSTTSSGLAVSVSHPAGSSISTCSTSPRGGGTTFTTASQCQPSDRSASACAGFTRATAGTRRASRSSHATGLPVGGTGGSEVYWKAATCPSSAVTSWRRKSAAALNPSRAVGGANTLTLPDCFTGPSTVNGPSGYGPRNFGSVGLGRGSRVVTVTSQSAAGSAVPRIVQTERLASVGRTTPGEGPPDSDAAVTSAPGGRASCQSFTGPRRRIFAVVSTCESSTRTTTSDSAVAAAGAAVVGGSHASSSVSVAPRA